MSSNATSDRLVITLLGVQAILLMVLLWKVDGLQDRSFVGEGRKSAPRAVVAGIEASDLARLGPKAAPVTIVEFSDFTCPACADSQAAVKAVVETFGDQVSVSYRFFPLADSGHPLDTALAAACAEDQEAFWPMHDALFAAGGESHDRANLVQLAAELGLDRGQFESCLASDGPVKRVMADREAGVAYGIQGTPTFFINGRRFLGSQSAESMISAVEEALAG